MHYEHTAYIMYTYMRTYVIDFDPSITTVPRILKSDKNWLNYGLLKPLFNEKKNWQKEVAWMDSWQRFFMISINLDWPQCYRKSAKSPFRISKSPPFQKKTQIPLMYPKFGNLIFWKKLTWNIRKLKKSWKYFKKSIIGKSHLAP